MYHCSFKVLPFSSRATAFSKIFSLSFGGVVVSTPKQTPLCIDGYNSSLWGMLDPLPTFAYALRFTFIFYTLERRQSQTHALTSQRWSVRCLLFHLLLHLFFFPSAGASDSFLLKHTCAEVTKVIINSIFHFLFLYL